MVDKKRLSVGALVLSLAAAWAPGCSSSDDKAANNAGSAGIGEAGAAGASDASGAGAPSGHAGASASGGKGDGGSSDGGEPSLSDAGSLGEAGEGGASNEPDPRDPFRAWATARATARCTNNVACGRWYSVASCVADALGAAAYDAYYGAADYYGDQLAHYSLASSAVQQTCLGELTAQACDSGPNPPLSCGKVLVPVAPTAKGASCKNGNPYLASLPCAAGLECSRAQCPVCVDETPLADLNAACIYQDDCKPGLVCKSAGDNTYTCQKTVALGQPCNSIDECAQGICLTTTCEPYVLDGKPCSVNAFCLRGLSCGDDNLCHPVPTPAPGAACKRHLGTSSEACSPSEWCVFATPSAATGTCGVIVGPGPVPCVRPYNAPALGCPFGTSMDAAAATNADGVPDSCTCQPRRPLGAACTAFQQCQNGNCVAGPNGSVCTARLPAGAPCTGAAGECAGFCDDETTHKCVGPVVCAP